MVVAIRERHDSLSPETGFRPTAPKCPDYQTVPQGPLKARTASEFKFILTKVSDFDEKAMISAQGGVSRKSNPKKTQSVSRDLKRLSSLAATHPALYQGANKACKQEMPSPPAHDHHRVKKEQSDRHRVKLEATDRIPVAPWQAYVDPKRLTSQEPAFSDPKVRMLRADVQNSHSRVVSPVLMVGLPCGTMIEAAHVYYDGQGQPRDPPGS